MINKLKQNKLILIIFMISIILIITGVTYSLYEILFTGRKEQVIDAGGIVFKYNETSDGLILDNNSILDDTAGSLPIPSSGMLSSCLTARWTKRIRSWRRPAAWRRQR